jgi:hypothetical protein
MKLAKAARIISKEPALSIPKFFWHRVTQIRDTSRQKKAIVYIHPLGTIFSNARELRWSIRFKDGNLAANINLNYVD